MIQFKHLVYFTIVPCLWSQIQQCNKLLDWCVFYGRLLSCFPVYCSAWISWRSVWRWTATIPLCWSSPQNQCPYRSNRPPVFDGTHFQQRKTRGTFRPAQHRSSAQSSKPAGRQDRMSQKHCFTLSLTLSVPFVVLIKSCNVLYNIELGC